MDQLFISRKVFVHGVHWLHETGGGKKVAAHYLHYVNETLINVQMTKKAWENQSACGLLDVRCRLFKKNRYFGFA